MNSPGSMEALSRWVEEIKHFEETLPSACFTFINVSLKKGSIEALLHTFAILLSSLEPKGEGKIRSQNHSIINDTPHVHHFHALACS